MEKKILIVGHGLAGCVLALSFYKKNIPFKIVGESREGEASMASSGLITPVTGRKYVKSWMIDEFIEAALEFYRWTEDLFGKRYFFPVDIVRFLSHPEALAAWEKRKREPEYEKYISDKRFEELDRLERPYGVLTGGYRLDAPGWIEAARNFLAKHNYLEQAFIPIEQDISEDQVVIYATGAVGTLMSKGLIPNKGEALVISMPEWKLPGIVKEEVYFVPLEGENNFWIGSYYERWPESTFPSSRGKQYLIQDIEKMYKGSFVVRAQLSGIRPTVDDRRPLIGPYPGHTGKYLFNGMGTKGTSLAPYWAQQLISHLTEGSVLPKAVHPGRYAGQQSG